MNNVIIYGGRGSDIIYGGKGSDIIYGGRGSDIIYGNAGQNTFSNAADGSSDVLNIQCEQKSSNIDIIEELDINDQINLIGTKNISISIRETSALGEAGIGIFANGLLETLYIGSNLSSAQLLDITTGLNK